MKELIIKKGRPLLNFVILTANKYSVEELAHIYGGIVPSGLTDQLKPYQKIVSISGRIRDAEYKVGDLVLINIQGYGRAIDKKNNYKDSTDEYYDAAITYSVPVIDIEGKEFLKLRDNDIEYIVDKFEIAAQKKVSSLIIGGDKLLTPTKSKIIQ